MITSRKDEIYNIKTKTPYDNRTDEQMREDTQKQREAADLAAAGLNKAIMGGGGYGGGGGGSKADEEEEKRKRKKEREEEAKQRQQEQMQQMLMGIIMGGANIGVRGLGYGMMNERAQGHINAGLERTAMNIASRENIANQNLTVKKGIQADLNKYRNRNLDIKEEQYTSTRGDKIQGLYRKPRRSRDHLDDQWNDNYK